MFNFFNKKTKEHISQETPEFVKLVERWEAFLHKINTRFCESLAQAEEAILENLVETNFDILPTTRAWHGIKSQLLDLTNKIETTFENHVKPQMRQYKEDYELLDEDQKGIKLQESIYHRTERFEKIIEGKIAKQFYNHAIQYLNKDFHCSQCNAKLEIKKDIFRSHYVSCQFCNTVNTFTPHSKINEIQNYAIDNIAHYNAINEWDQLKNIEAEFHQVRPPAKGENRLEYENVFKKREQAEKTFWNKYLQERAILNSEYTKTLEHDLEVKMSHFYEYRKRHLNY